MNWQPIETAPTDGTPVLIFDLAEKNPRDAIVVAYWCSCEQVWFVAGSNQDYEIENATHWRQRPDAPSEL